MLKEMDPRFEHFTPEEDAKYLRRAIAVAEAAKAAGNHPFGAVLVDLQGHILMEQGNIEVTEKVCTGHAETTLLQRASHRYTHDFLWNCTLYSSIEPCCMCCGAAYWANLGRIVFAATEKDLLALIIQPSPVTAAVSSPGARKRLSYRAPFLHCARKRSPATSVTGSKLLPFQQSKIAPSLGHWAPPLGACFLFCLPAICQRGFFPVGELLELPFAAHGFGLCGKCLIIAKLHRQTGPRVFCALARLMHPDTLWQVVCPASVIGAVTAAQ